MALGGLVGTWNLAEAAALESARPNVLLITLDTTRADRLEPYGASDVATPNLAALAADGVVFENAFAVAPITLVAHASILTGLDPTNHGVHNNGTHDLQERFETLAEGLRAEGYQTAAFVAASVLEKRFNLDQGFDHYDDDLSAGLTRHRHVVADRPASAVVDATLGWLDGVRDDAPWFVWVHFYDPHAVYAPPGEFREQYRGRLYDGEIAYMDSQIGRLLKDSRAADAVWMVIGDHGESLGEHGEQTHGLLAYDATLRIPWIMRFPIGPRRARVRVPVSQVDLVPTLLGHLKIQTPGDLDGLNLMPLLRGQAKLPERDLYAETFLPYYTYGWAKLRSLRRGSIKWIDAPSPELYQTDKDPLELANIAALRPDLASALSAALLAHTARDDGDDPTLQLDAATIAKLQALGYLAVGTRKDTPSDATRPDPKQMIDVHAGLERARLLVAQGLDRQAHIALERVLERDPDNLTALVDLATLEAGQGNLQRAVEQLERALSLDPDYARLHLILAGIEERRAGAEPALKLTETALELDPHSAEGLAKRVGLLFRLGREAEARAASKAALALLPDTPALQLQHAQLFEAANDPEAAKQRLRRALERDPHLIAAWILLGELFESEDNSREAAVAYQSALARAPDHAAAHAKLGMLLARSGSQSALAIGHLSEAIRLSDHPSHDLRVALGALYAETGRLDRAKAAYEKVLEAAPSHAGARNNHAILLYRKGQTAEAEAALRALVREQPQNADALNNLAAIALDRHDDSAAAAFARRAVTIAPNAAEAWNNLGLALQATKTEEARRALERALELQPDYWQAHMHLGLLLTAAEDHVAAAAALDRATTIAPNDAETHLALARVYADHLDRPDLAVEHFNAFLSLAPQHPEAGAARERASQLRP